MEWKFHIEDPSNLSGDSPRISSDFLDEASLRMRKSRKAKLPENTSA